MIPYPNRKILFASFSCRQAQHGLNFVERVRGRPIPVQAQKQSCRDQSNPFVSIHERMISWPPQSVGACQGGQVHLRIEVPLIEWLRQRGIEQSSIPNPRASAMLRETFRLECVLSQQLASFPVPRSDAASAFRRSHRRQDFYG